MRTPPMEIILVGHKNMASLAEQPIPSIKVIRKVTGWGLKDSKKAVERFVESTCLSLPLLPYQMERPVKNTPADFVAKFQELGFTVTTSWECAEECAGLWLVGWKTDCPQFYGPLHGVLRRVSGLSIEEGVSALDEFLSKGLLQVEYYSCPDYPSLISFKKCLNTLGIEYSDTFEPYTRLRMLFEED